MKISGIRQTKFVSQLCLLLILTEQFSQNSFSRELSPFSEQISQIIFVHILTQVIFFRIYKLRDNS